MMNRSQSTVMPLSLSLFAGGVMLLFSVASEAANVNVNVSSDEFNPPVVVIQTGDTVTWENVQGTHNVNADDGSFRSGDPEEAPWFFTQSFPVVGTFLYHCELHGGPDGDGHSGTVVVEEGTPGTVHFASEDPVVDEDEGLATLIVRRTNGRNGPASVSYETLNTGTATSGVDYQEVSGTLTWDDGDDDPKTFTVPIVDDAEAEDNETIGLRVFDAVGAELGTPDTTELLIVDDESTNPECEPDGVTLCLLGERFRVRATFETAQGVSGQARAVPLTADTGYFWFFNRSNVEVVVKALDGCPNNSHFWVFAGGLTNVRVRLRVVDTETGESRVYLNPLRTPFAPLQDTRAFATCL